MQLKQIKTPDLARAIGMSIRNLRRYESGELKLKSINALQMGRLYMEKVGEKFYDAKVGLLIETLASPKINDALLSEYKCQKTDDNHAPIHELERLAKVGQTVGEWYFNDEFKREMIK